MNLHPKDKAALHLFAWIPLGVTLILMSASWAVYGDLEFLQFIKGRDINDFFFRSAATVLVATATILVVIASVHGTLYYGGLLMSGKYHVRNAFAQIFLLFVLILGFPIMIPVFYYSFLGSNRITTEDEIVITLDDLEPLAEE